jgi:predicted pyridoxine 5'-phosphate oxidase superfamily flavin-nucleotide-binding protein
MLMSEFEYGAAARSLQDRFDTRRLADALAQVIVRGELNEADRAFIGACDMFWLATVDAQGMPTVSYKGGAAGFVHMTDERTLLFPCYDGNGMFLSMGNMAATAEVGLLFMDFEHPHRLRVQGSARLVDDPEHMALYPGAQLVVTVAIGAIFQNCPRYVHPMQRTGSSRYIPAGDGSAPLAGWKRIDAIQPVLPARDQGLADQAGGTLTMAQYGEMLARGDSNA